MNPLRDCHLRTHQILRGHTRIFASAHFLQLKNVSHVAVRRTMCNAGPKSARPSSTPLSEPQWGLPLIEPLCPYSRDYNRRSRSNERKLSIPSTSRTTAARRGELSTNLLAGLDTPLGCAPENSIASQLMKNEAHKTSSRESTRLVSKQLSDLWKIPTPEGHSISEDFAVDLRHLIPGKSLGLISIWLEFILHARSALKSWFCDFLGSCMRQLKISKIWKRALVVAIPKPEKPLGDPNSYRSISLLCVLFKILERLIYARQNNHRPIAPTGAGGLPTWMVGRRPGHPVDTGHRG